MNRLTILILLTFTSCIYHEVSIKRNNSAHVEITLNYLDPKLFGKAEEDSDWEDETEKVAIPDSIDLTVEAVKLRFDSKSIKNLFISEDTDGNPNQVSFDIDPIDSLGSYLDPYSKFIFTTKLENNRFHLYAPSGHSNPESDICGCMNLLIFKTILTFEQEIVKIETPNSYIKQLDNKRVEINTSLGELAFNKLENKLIVVLK